MSKEKNELINHNRCLLKLDNGDYVLVPRFSKVSTKKYKGKVLDMCLVEDGNTLEKIANSTNLLVGWGPIKEIRDEIEIFDYLEIEELKERARELSKLIIDFDRIELEINKYSLLEIVEDIHERVMLLAMKR